MRRPSSCPIGAAGVPLYADARHYAAAGIPTVMYGAGPRTLLEANGHRADERLRLEDLRLATNVVALALAERHLSISTLVKPLALRPRRVMPRAPSTRAPVVARSGVLIKRAST